MPSINMQANILTNHTQEEARILNLLQCMTYEQVSEQTGWSRGRIYALALRSGARKTERRIMERASERRLRQLQSLQEMVGTTVTADVLDFLNELPDSSVSMHFTSPPYNLGKRYGNAPGSDVMRFTYFHGWLMQVISEMSRTLKDGGVICVNTAKTMDWQDNLMPMDVMLFEDFRRCGLTFQNRIVWTANHGLTPTSRLADRYETVLVFSKGSQVTFNPNAARTSQKQPDKRAYKGPNKGKLSGNPYGAHPSDVWSDIGQVKNDHPDRAHGDHPAQFPVKLPKRAILLYTKAGELVCDPFIGSGSTAVAAKECGRAFVGADLFYSDLREKRIEAAIPDSYSTLPGVTDESVAVWQAEARKVEQVARPITQSQERTMCRQLGLLDSLF